MATFGKNILENLTTGMYYNSLVIYREYIQNACDQIDIAIKEGLIAENEASIDIEIDEKKRRVTIRDNATGITKENFRHQLEDIANSDKIKGVNKGFRGIGRLCGLAYCKTLIFKATAKGEKIRSILTMDAKLMRTILDSSQKVTADEVLQKITSYTVEEADVNEHGFSVCLDDINTENTDLLNIEKVEKYLSFVAPVPYNSKFYLREKIYQHAGLVGYHIDEYKIFVNGNQIFKNYGTRLYDKSNSNGNKKTYDELIDVAFEDIYKEGELIAWLWYGISRFDKAIPKSENPMYGLRVRQSNIQIGDNTSLAKFFKEDRGNSYFVGEVFVVSDELTPNSQRDNFNEGSMRVFFEDEIQKLCYDKLHKLYNMAAKLKGNYKALTEYANLVEEYKKKKEKGFINSKEAENFEQKVEDAENRKNEAQKAISKIPKETPDVITPETRVQCAIRDYFQSKEVEEKVIKAEKEKIENDDPEKETTHYFTDSLAKLDKRSRKLVAQIVGIVAKHTDEKTINEIKNDIEKEFK